MTGLPPKQPIRMRARCKCGSVDGYITETGAQDVVRCSSCNRFQYNAPRVETGKAVRSVSTVHAAITGRQRAEVLLRAQFRCEMCGHRPTKETDELHVGHFISVKSGLEFGMTDEQINSIENLFCQCAQCNLGLKAEVVPLWLMVATVMARTKRSRE